MWCPKLRMVELLACSWAAAVFVGLAGCNNTATTSVVPVTGEVLLDGEPLKFGTVTFQSARGQPAMGTIDPDGKFSLSTYRQGDGAAVGRNKVKITCYTSQDPSQQQAAAVETLGESLIPDRYTRFDHSGLEVAVLATGNKPFRFELLSDKAAVAVPPDAPETASSDTDGAEPDADQPPRS